jgi:hypothetical protein
MWGDGYISYEFIYICRISSLTISFLRVCNQPFCTACSSPVTDIPQDNCLQAGQQAVNGKGQISLCHSLLCRCHSCLSTHVQECLYVRTTACRVATAGNKLSTAKVRYHRDNHYCGGVPGLLFSRSPCIIRSEIDNDPLHSCLFAHVQKCLYIGTIARRPDAAGGKFSTAKVRDPHITRHRSGSPDHPT